MSRFKFWSWGIILTLLLAFVPLKTVYAAECLLQNPVVGGQRTGSLHDIAAGGWPGVDQYNTNGKVRSIFADGGKVTFSGWDSSGGGNGVIIDGTGTCNNFRFAAWHSPSDPGVSGKIDGDTILVRPGTTGNIINGVVHNHLSFGSKKPLKITGGINGRLKAGYYWYDYRLVLKKIGVAELPEKIVGAIKPFPATSVQLEDGNILDICGYYAGDGQHYDSVVKCNDRDEPDDDIISEVDLNKITAASGVKPEVPADEAEVQLIDFNQLIPVDSGDETLNQTDETNSSGFETTTIVLEIPNSNVFDLLYKIPLVTYFLFAVLMLLLVFWEESRSWWPVWVSTSLLALLAIGYVVTKPESAQAKTTILPIFPELPRQIEINFSGLPNSNELEELAILAIPTETQKADEESLDQDKREPSGECKVVGKYPDKVMRWCDLITKYSERNDLDPDLVAALILQESGGNEKAYSKSGAVGLMQVMPRDGIAASFTCSTGPCFANRPTVKQLQDPKFNIQYC